MSDDTFRTVEGIPCLMHVHTIVWLSVKVVNCSLSFLVSANIFLLLLYDQTEIEMHAKPGSLSVYVHYGQSRPKDAKLLSQSDVVITTYGVLTSEFSQEVSFIQESSGHGLFHVYSL